MAARCLWLRAVAPLASESRMLADLSFEVERLRRNEARAGARQLVRAHQYLYYVLCKTVWSDFEYDRFCKAHGIEGGGGSDSARDYTAEEIALATSLIK
jgi:hypothetical protein